MAKVRQAHLKVTYNGTDISEDISRYLISFSYTDHIGGKADDLQIQVENRQGLWTGSWFPTKGAILKAEIKSTLDGAEKVLNCGTFAIDEITAQGPPDTVTIKAVSSLTAKSLKREKKSKAWESFGLKEILNEIANRHGLTAFYQADENPEYVRLDQKEESDLAFLNRICRENDLSLKLSDEKIIIFEGLKFEQAAPICTISRGKSVISGHSVTSKTFDIYRACKVHYMDPDAKGLNECTFTPPDAPNVGQVLQANRRVESLAQAQKLARSMLRQKNAQEITGNINLMGNTILLSGLTHNLAGFGVFDGKYIIDEATHKNTRAAGYTTAIKSRKVLSW